jgi:hypothetical protein
MQNLAGAGSTSADKIAVTIWTTGHSTRSLDELIDTLKAHQIEGLVDVRSFPTSKRHPYFNRALLSVELARSSVGTHRRAEVPSRPQVLPQYLLLSSRNSSCNRRDDLRVMYCSSFAGDSCGGADSSI